MKISKDKFDLLEVRANTEGFYFVTMYQFDKIDIDHPDYIKDWLYFDGDKWEYCGEYKDACYVCFIHSKDDGKKSWEDM